ncbi:LOW QUALITY PROTEIN: arginine kinase-like isoform X2 [Vespula squamosa]|uniref:Arginine kinase-like isoform X2 n=1 Tax=Vespula squamosa TaxID=30214 RepID=A0ABD1ZUF3_VESSQ
MSRDFSKVSRKEFCQMRRDGKKFGFTIDNVHSDSNWGMPDDDLGNVDPTGSWVLSIISTLSIQEYPFYPTANEAHYREIEDKERRIFVNDDKSFVQVFINENFYRTRLISMENGGKLANVYGKRIRDWAMSVFSGLRLDFNLGITIRTFVHPSFPNLALETTTGSRKFANTYGHWVEI